MKDFLNKFRNHFIPHKDNNYEPHLMRKRTVRLIASVLIIFELVFIIETLVIFDKTQFLAAVLPGVLTSETNKERALNKLEPLTVNPVLVEAAQLKANDMASRGYFAHNTPDGKTPWYWLDQVGYTYSYAGENLAVNFTESSEVTSGWMNSPTHRANIVKPGYTEVGIAVARGIYKGQESTYVVQFFGTPVKTIPTINDILPKIEKKVSVSTTTKKPELVKAPVIKVKEPVNTATKNVVKGDKVEPEKTIKKTTVVLGEEVEKILATPGRSVNKVYVTIAGFFSLLVLLAFMFGNTNARAILRSVFLIAVIASLFYINQKVFPVDTIIPQGGNNSVSASNS